MQRYGTHPKNAIRLSTSTTPIAIITNDVKELRDTNQEHAASDAGKNQRVLPNPS